MKYLTQGQQCRRLYCRWSLLRGSKYFDVNLRDVLSLVVISFYLAVWTVFYGSIRAISVNVGPLCQQGVFATRR